MRSGEADQLAQTIASGLPLVVTAAHELKAPLALLRQLGLALQVPGVTPEESSRTLVKFQIHFRVYCSPWFLDLAQDGTAVDS